MGCDPCYGSDERSQHSDSFDEGLQHSEHTSMLLLKMKKNDPQNSILFRALNTWTIKSIILK